MLILYVPNFELATHTMSQVSENKTLEATPHFTFEISKSCVSFQVRHMIFLPLHYTEHVIHFSVNQKKKTKRVKIVYNIIPLVGGLYISSRNLHLV